MPPAWQSAAAASRENAVTRQLLIMRHAKSSWDDPQMTDHSRPLNARGRLAATAMRRALGDLGLAPDLVLVSPARRTLQTLAALEPWPETPLVEPLEQLYLADLAQLLAVLRGVAPTVRSVLLIGHNPGLHELALCLVGPAAMAAPNEMTRQLAEGYPTGALCEFAVPDRWDLLGEGGGRLQHFFGPRDLPEFAG
jgi:phosphohistidine phosphatase